MNNPIRYFNSSPEVIRLAVMMYVRYPLSLRQVEDILFERGIDIYHETVRFWWNRFEGGKGRWGGSGTSRPCKNSPLSMPRPTTTSTTNAISPAATFSNSTAPLPWPSGANSQPERPRLKLQ